MLISLAIVALFLWIAYDQLVSKTNRPPGPFRLPFLGNIIQLTRWSKKVPHTHIMLQKFSKEYGPVATLKFGLLEQLIVDDTTMIREILQADSWAQRPVNEYILDRSYGEMLGILWSRGEMSKEMRRFSLRTLRDFGFGKQKSQEAVMEEELRELMSKLNAKLESEGSTILMQQFFSLSVLNIIWSMVAGVRFAHDDPGLNKLVNMINRTMRLLAATGNIMLAYPFLRHFLPMLTGFGKIRKECIAQLQNQFMEILNERRKSGHYKEEQRDFIDVFVGEIEKHKSDSLAYIYTDKQFVTTVLDLFVAGSETTSNSLEFSILLMLLNPDVQEKVRREIDQVVGRHKIVNYTDKQEMPYTEATILEILRVSSVVPLIARTALEETTIGSYKIPKETYTILNTYSAHRDPKIWTDPERFYPDRFLENGKVVNADKLIPFGLGKRYCLGEVLARATLFTYFVTMMQNYTFSKSLNHPEPSLEGLPGITLSPQPFYAVIQKRD